MKKIVGLAVMALLFAAPRVLARGDKVVPQVVDGPEYRTKFAFFNPSGKTATNGYWLKFYRQDGKPWSLSTTMGVGSEFSIKIPPHGVVIVETLGASGSTVAGYATIVDSEVNNSVLSQEFEIGCSVFYEYRTSSGVADIVSVPIGQRTAIAALQVAYDNTEDLYTGFAVVNLSAAPNLIQTSLFGGSPTGADSEFTLGPGEQRAEFLHQRLYPALGKFSGVLELYSQGPISVVALRQSRAVSGVQFSILPPVYKDDLKKSTYVLLPAPLIGQEVPMPFDADGFTVDYLRANGQGEEYNWDIVYESLGPGRRQIRPYFGKVASLGIMDDKQFDSLNLQDLRAQTFSPSNLDLSDDGGNLQLGFTFALLTDLGNYVKVHIIRIITTIDGPTGGEYKDLGLELYVYR